MIHFLLTPDKSSSLALKRLVAQQGARMDLAVGTWPELLTLAKNCHVLPAVEDDWQTRLVSAVKLQRDAFWSESLANVPAEEQSIIEIIGRNLVLLLEAFGPEGRLDSIAGAELPGRLAKRVADFARLHAVMDYQLPPDLGAVRSILDIGPGRTLRTIRVYHLGGWPRLSPWQQALVAVLAGRADADADPSLVALLEAVVSIPTAPPNSALHHLQASMFAPAAGRKPLDETLQWLGCRDYLQEVEISAGMVQKAMADDRSLQWSDFALLLPSDDRYRQAAYDAFSLAGIPLSGLSHESAGRDPGREAVYYFLLCKKGLAPAMAFAALLTSPLMPWTTDTGNRLAQKVIKGDFQLTAPDCAGKGCQAMLAAIRKPVSTPAELSGNLGSFLKQLLPYRGADDPMNIPRQCCQETVALIMEKLAAAPRLHDVLWDDLLRACTPQPTSAGNRAGSDLTREGVAVFHEGEEPWRRARRLFILGCCEGHYPGTAARSPVFFASDLKVLLEGCGLSVETPEDRGSRLREVFRRQLCAASDRVTLLVPRRDGMGKALAPSPSLAFMASLLDGVGDDEKLIVDLDCESGLKAARGLAMAQDLAAAAPWMPVADDLELGADLVALRAGAESPSRLETLMVSPLAWLFQRMGVEAPEWAPEKLDVSGKGTLAHKVFEKLFCHGATSPESGDIASRVPVLLEEAMAGTCPFLKRDEWKVEREHLAQDIIKAALRWQEILGSLGAKVLATEVKLQGTLKLGVQADLQIHGDADLLLGLPGNRLFVVDYKKSGSKGRRLRMKAGYDHQASLYRTMIETGGLEYPEKTRPGLAGELAGHRASGEIRALYYLMNDQAVLTDSDGWLGGSFPGSPEMGAGISREALPLIEKRIGEARRGIVELNSETDGKEFKDERGLGTYALEGSPLVKLFAKKTETI